MKNNLAPALFAALLTLATPAVPVLAQSASGPYKVAQSAKVGGAGSFDYVNADSDGRKLYVARSGQTGARITVFNLDTLAPAGEIPDVGAHGVAVDPASHHGFASSKPIVMFDTNTLEKIKTIDVEGGPDRHPFSSPPPNGSTSSAIARPTSP